MRTTKERVAGLAANQFGRVGRAQLRALGVDDHTLHDWVAVGYLHRVLPRVYAVGHRARSTEADLIAAVIYAGPGAMLSHATAAWWVGLADSRPYMIDVSTPRRPRPIPGIRLHRRRTLERDWHKGLPVTTFAQTLIDYATTASLSKLRRALAQADFEGGLNSRAIEAALGRGRSGAAKLRAALGRHQPMLAQANSGLEIALFELCENNHLPLPELNARIVGWEVDALWREQRVVVELDGPDNHRSPAQIRRDRRKELELRVAAFTVLRYSDDQMNHHSAAIAAELRATLSPASSPP